MSQSRKNNGFTLIELMLAMGFVSALLLAIAMTVIQISNIYNSGLTFKNVNQFGGSLSSTLERDINQSGPFDIADSFVESGTPEITGGRLCIGQYSYIWNYGKALQDATPPSSLNVFVDSHSDTKISFVKVIDNDGYYCTNKTSKIDFDSAVELLNVDRSNQYLAIHNFSINQISHDPATNQYLYEISFKIGTNDQVALNGNLNSTECRLPDDVDSNSTYCAVNRFDIVARAGGNSNSTSE